MMCTTRIFHTWEKWSETEMAKRQTPLGNAYPEEVRGKTFETVITVQRRQCTVCGYAQVRRLTS